MEIRWHDQAQLQVFAEEQQWTMTMRGTVDLKANAGPAFWKADASGQGENVARASANVWWDEEFTVASSVPYTLVHTLEDPSQFSDGTRTRVILYRRISGELEVVSNVGVARSGYFAASGTLDAGTYVMRVALDAATGDIGTHFLRKGARWKSGDRAELTACLDLGELSNYGQFNFDTQAGYRDSAARVADDAAALERCGEQIDISVKTAVGSLPAAFDEAFRVIPDGRRFLIKPVKKHRHR
ncbi:MAG: hypothetical protein EOP83_36675, partial [Verrucomicrobiaceae bacterium]